MREENKAASGPLDLCIGAKDGADCKGSLPCSNVQGLSTFQIALTLSSTQLSPVARYAILSVVVTDCWGPKYTSSVSLSFDAE